MRFFTCYSLTQKRGFFIYQSFFFYDRPISLFWEATPYLPMRHFFSYTQLLLNLHGDLYPGEDAIVDFLGEEAPRFGLFMLKLITPHLHPEARYEASVVRLARLGTTRGKRMAKRLPARGQRTRSNSNVQNLARKRNQKIIILAR